MINNGNLLSDTDLIGITGFFSDVMVQRLLYPLLWSVQTHTIIQIYHPNLSGICTQSVSLVVYYMTFIKKSYPFMVHPLLPVPRSYRNLGVIPG